MNDRTVEAARSLDRGGNTRYHFEIADMIKSEPPEVLMRLASHLT